MMMSSNKKKYAFLHFLSATCVVVSATAFSATSTDASAPAVVPSSLDAIWNDVPQGPPDAILGIAQAFRAAPEEHKVNVCVGAYRDTAGLPWVLPSVRKAEEMMLADATENKEYLPIDGRSAVLALLFPSRFFCRTSFAESTWCIPQEIKPTWQRR